MHNFCGKQKKMKEDLFGTEMEKLLLITGV
jgi:hypothetical protein